MRNIRLNRHDVGVPGRFRRASMTTLSNGALSGVRAVMSFLTVSMLVRYMGRESYGLCATITGIASWLSVAQGGIGQSLKNDMIREPESASALFSGAFAFLLAVVLTTGAFLTGLLSMAAWLVPGPWKPQYPLIVMSVWIALLTALLSLVRVAWSAFQLEYKLTPALLAGVLISFGLVVTGIQRGWDVAIVVSASLTANVIGLAFGLISMPVRFSRPKRLYRAGLWFFVIEACTVLIFESDMILISLIVGSGQTAVFALHAQLFAYLQTGIFLVVSPYWAAFGEAWHGGDRVWLITGVRRLTRVSVLLSCTGALFLMAIGQPLMKLWSHGQIEWNPLLGLLMGANTAIQGVTGVYATALGALGVARDPARIVIVQAFLNIGVCIWAIRRFGITGAAMGSLITYALTSGLYLPWKVRRVTACV